MSTTRTVLSGLVTATVLSTVVVAVHATPAQAVPAPTLCVVPSTGGVARFNLGGSGFTQIRTTATATVYGGGGYGVVAVNPSVPEAWLKRPTSSTWTMVARPGLPAAWDYQTTDTALYLLLGPSPTQKTVRRYNGSGSSWTTISGQFRTMYTGNYGLFARQSSAGDIYRYSGSGSSWSVVGGPGYSFAVTNTALYGLNPDRTGIFQYNGSGTAWTNIGGGAWAIYGGGHGLFATLKTNGNLFRYLGTPGAWEDLGQPPGGIRSATVTNNAVFAEDATFSRVFLYEAFDGGGWATVSTSPVGSMVACP
ncbi:hypothetical protein [Phytohabitans rumicis]|nr:hypothetical protein [Phytohabitans rumicis]